ncbi:MAG: DUF362 domain-containing protein [Deltaproteobacteria bacterium]|nr:DUF362 domain-containing protein [Deltaproteobacteria bacterium]
MRQNTDDIVVIYGDRPVEMVRFLLDCLGIEKDLPTSGTIGIKPNLLMAKPSDSGATTDPEIVAGVIEYLYGLGRRDVIILESSWVGDTTRKAYRVCGYKELAGKYGVPLIDLKKDTTRKIRSGNMNVEVCERALGLAYLINIPVLKAHCQTRLTCALKNLKGCIPDVEKRRFHTLGIHEPVARLNTVIKTDLVIVDGIIGDLTFEEGGTPVRMNRLIAGRDPVLIDAYAAGLIGYSPDDIDYIAMAEEMGVGTADTTAAQILELNQPDDGVASIHASRAVEDLMWHVNEDQACSACFGSLVHALKRLSDMGALTGLKGRISIGQGFAGKTGKGIGIGTCAEGLSHSLRGCPPTARRIVEYLMKYHSH